MADYWVQYREQTIIGLQWGEGEDFLWNPTPVDKFGLGEGGTLPRATKSISASQQRLVETAMAQKGRKILCCHFTLVNYAMDVPLGQSGRVGFRDQDFSRYEQGSTKAGRDMLHGQWLANNQLQLSLSGHSHRVGLYRCANVPAQQPFMARAGTSAYLQLGASMSTANQPAHLQTWGYHPEDPATKQVTWGDRTRVFVSASAGPIPKQNLHGEMSNQGMEYPSAGKIIFNGNAPEITLVKSSRTTAKPRFAVACDYIDIMADGFWKYFRATGNEGEFEMKIHWEKIHPNFPQNKKGQFVENMTMWLVGSGRAKQLGSKLHLAGDSLIVGFPSTFSDQLKKDFTQGAFFLSVNFKADAVQHLPGFKDYDYESPWNIQVGIYDSKDRETSDKPENHKLIIDSPFGRYLNNKLHTPDKDSSRWQIKRHKKCGEIPDFDWRAESYPVEFAFMIRKN